MTPPGVRSDSRGFTLVELLTALALLSLLLLPALGRISITLFKGERHLNEMQTAQLLLRSELNLHCGGDETQQLDTLMADGSRFLVTNRFYVLDSDTIRSLVVMTMRGSRWDTLLTVSRAAEYGTKVLSH